MRRLFALSFALVLVASPVFAELVCIELLACGLPEDSSIPPVASAIESALMNPWFNAGHIASNDVMQSRPNDYSAIDQFPLPATYRLEEIRELDAGIFVLAILQFPASVKSSARPSWLWIQIRDVASGRLLAERKMPFEIRVATDKEFYTATESMMQDVMQEIRGR